MTLFKSTSGIEPEKTWIAAKPPATGNMLGNQRMKEEG